MDNTDSRRCYASCSAYATRSAAAHGDVGSNYLGRASGASAPGPRTAEDLAMEQMLLRLGAGRWGAA